MLVSIHLFYFGNHFLRSMIPRYMGGAASIEALTEVPDEKVAEDR